MKILFLVTEDWYFLSHRLALARRLRDMGAEVVVMTRVTKLGDAIEREHFRIIPWSVLRRSLNPIHEFFAFWQVLRAYRRERPVLAHHVALKPLVFGGIAARLTPGVCSVNAISGMGHVFVNETGKFGLLRRALFVVFKWALNSDRARAIFQNRENMDAFVHGGVMNKQKAVLIRGVGVNPQEFQPRPEPAAGPIVVLASRLLWEKGVGEFVTAAEKLRAQGLKARFVLVGDSDAGHRDAVPPGQLRDWVGQGAIEWWGHRSDMPTVFAESSLVCFPSYYGEGVPKVLMEAAASGRAIVTTDAPGCRDVVRDGQNGLLVPPRDPAALAEALKKLLSDPDLRARMGACGRKIAEEEFSEDLIIGQTLAVYRELLGPRWTLESRA